MIVKIDRRCTTSDLELEICPYGTDYDSAEFKDCRGSG